MKRNWQREIVARIAATPERLAGLILADNSADAIPACSDMHTVGSLVRIGPPVEMGDRLQFIAEGLARFWVLDWISETSPYCICCLLQLTPRKACEIKPNEHALRMCSYFCTD